MRHCWVLFGILLLFAACKSKQLVQHVAEVETGYVLLDSLAAADADIEALINPYRTTLEREMNLPLGELAVTLTKRRPNSNLGNWFSDILEETGRFIYVDKQVDFAIQNYGGLRINALQKGTLKVGDIYSLMPFDNTLVLVAMDQSVFQQLMDLMAASGGWPISKSLSYTLQDEKAVDILINEQPVVERDSFYVLMPDYVANGGSSCSFLKNCSRSNAQLFIRDLVIEHLSELQEQGLTAPIDTTQRIKIKS